MINRCAIYFMLGGLLFPLNALRAQILTFDHGQIEFYTASILSDIEAVSNTAEVKLDVPTGNIEVTINVKSFNFEYDLMKAHFNEKYLESDKYPQAIFKGKIAQDLSKNFTEMEVDAVGELTIHGVTRAIKATAQISKNGDYTIIKSKIPVVFKDYNVDDPSILTKSVAKDVEIKSTLYLK